MRVVDSSAWVEWIKGTPLKPSIAAQMPGRGSLVVPTMVQMEVVKWVLREGGGQIADWFVAFTNRSVVVPLTTTIAIQAAEVCRVHRLATADAIIYATAIGYDADLVTCDAHFAGLERVLHIPKQGSH